MDQKIKGQQWPESFVPLNKFLGKFSSQFREWATCLNSQVFFFESVIRAHSQGEEAVGMQSRDWVQPPTRGVTPRK